jgi:hypothetical protein
MRREGHEKREEKSERARDRPGTAAHKEKGRKTSKHELDFY